MKERNILVLVLTALTLMLSTNAGALEREALKSMKADCYARFSEARRDMFNPENLRLADSLERVPEASKDMRLKIAADILRFPVYFAQEKVDSMEMAFVNLKRNARNSEYKYFYYFACDGQAQMYTILGDRARAMMYAREMLKEATKDRKDEYLEIAYKAMGCQYANRSNYLKAIEYFYKSAEHLPEGSSLYLEDININLIETLICAGRFDEARGLLDETLKVMPEDDFYIDNIRCLRALLAAYTYDRAGFEKFYPLLFDKRGETRLQPESAAELMALNALWKGNGRLAGKYMAGLGTETRYRVMNFGCMIKGDYLGSTRIKDMMMQHFDSVQTAINTEELVLSDSKLNNAILKEEAEIARSNTQLAISVAVVLIMVILLVVAAVAIRRHRIHSRVMAQKNLELEKARNEAEKASKIKSIFIKNMTHELHTPMNEIYGFAQVLADPSMPDDPETAREMAKYICEGAENLTRVLDNIIEVSNRLEGAESLSEVESVLK